MTLDEYVEDLEKRIKQFKEYWKYCQSDSTISQFYPDNFECSGDWDEHFISFLNNRT